MIIYNKLLRLFVVSIFALIGFGQYATAQIEFKVELLESGEYQVILKPTTSSPNDITSTAQVTLVVPTGGFEVSNVQNVNGAWAPNALIESPDESPEYDYLNFGLTSFATTEITYVENVEEVLFTFENSGACTGACELMTNDDPFFGNPNYNVGNQITTLQFGNQNAWIGNYDLGSANCSGPVDTDGDGVIDSEDCAPNDASASVTDACGICGGDGSTCTDADGDGVNADEDPDDTNPCVPNNFNMACDSDGDGTPDGVDCAPNDATASTTDICGVCGGDGSTCTDADGDGVNADEDPDDTNPCVPNNISPACDSDGDGVADGLDCAPNDASASQEDGCGVCGGNGSTCTDNDNDGVTADTDPDDLDACVPDASNANCIANDPDCSVIVETIAPTCGQCNGYIIANIPFELIDGTNQWLFEIFEGPSIEGEPIEINATLFPPQIQDELCPGAYSMRITGLNGTIDGCEQIVENIILEDPEEGLEISTSSMSGDCGEANGSITIDTNLEGEYTAIVQPGDITENFTNSVTFTDLVPNAYLITFESSSGCSIELEPVIVETTASPISITNITVNDPLCDGDANGSIAVEAEGGALPLEYSLDFGTTWVEENTFTDLAQGGYFIIVRDSNGCTADSEIIYNLVEPDPLSVFTEVTPITCEGDTNGEILINVAGGVGAISYSIDGGENYQTSNTFSNLAPASYTISVQDENGCTSQLDDEVVIEDTSAITYVSIDTADSSECDVNDAIISINVSGGTPPYFYSIDGGEFFSSENTFAELYVGTYNIVVIDAVFCTMPYSSPIIINSEEGPCPDFVIPGPSELLAIDDEGFTIINEPVEINALDNDNIPEGATVSFCGLTQPSNGSVIYLPEGEFMYTPANDYAGADIFQYTICDEDGNESSAFVIINIVDPSMNGACTNEIINACTEPLTPIEFCPDFCALDEYEIISATTTYSCSISVLDEGCIRYIPLPGYFGLDEITVTACNDEEECDQITIIIDVTESCNEPPVAVDDQYMTTSMTPIDFDVTINDSDPNGDALEICDYTMPSNGNLTLADGTFIYFPDAGFSGTDTFEYTVCDENGEEDTAVVTILVDPPCNPEEICVEPITLTEICVEYCYINTDNAEITNVSSTNPSVIQISTVNCVYYASLEGFLGQDVIVITTCDDNGNCEEVNVPIEVGACETGAPGIPTSDLGGNAGKTGTNECKPIISQNMHLGGTTNEVLVIDNNCEDIYFNLVIFNMNGMKVYESLVNNTRLNWTGLDQNNNKLPIGNYVYRLVDNNGLAYSGSIALIR